MRWDPAQYGRFAAERDRPFFDLTSRIEAVAPRHVVDVGCGQGHLTATLSARWPDAVVEGIDSSEEMIAEAAGVAGVAFSVADAASWEPADDVEVIVSNAALQWVPRHQELLLRWASSLPAGGWLAVQVPGNFDSPSHVLMRQVARREPWAARLHDVVRDTDAVGTPESYASVLLSAGLRADVWETTYLHVLHGDDPVLEWVRGTGLRPILAALTPVDAEEFVRQLTVELREAYPPGPHGTLFPFRRVFAVGYRA
ncbi:MAG TPA: trans-aconitate 2-methyltransferase [Mycobacterium sp.]|nr:trans-aconitate 2-methyltransferase [Mycobacterium sp.]